MEPNPYLPTQNQEIPVEESQKKKKTKPKKEIDDLEKIEANGLDDLQEKLKGMKISKKLKKKLLKEEAERQKIMGRLFKYVVIKA